MAGSDQLLAAAYQALQSRRFADAERLCRDALASHPSEAAGWILLGMACHRKGRPAEAVEWYGRALRLRPGVPDVHYQLANAYRDQGFAIEAEQNYRRTVELKPDHVDALINLAIVLQDQKRLVDSESYLRRALALRPNSIAAVLNLGTILEERGQLTEAEACFQQAAQLQPDLPGAYSNLGLVQRHQGRVEEAEANIRHALALDAGSAEFHDALLMTLQYRSGVTPAMLAAEHAEYQRRHAEPLRSTWRPHTNNRDPERRLRIGFASADLWRHPVAFLLVRGFEALARRDCDLVCYSDRPAPPDEMTRRVQAAASLWRDTAPLTDDQFSEQVRADGIDILIDLVGHTGGNRLLAFARRPAPVQVTWLGYEGTTGLEAIDYIIADERLVPLGAEQHYREKVLRLPGGYCCYDPLAGAPAPGPLPALSAGHVTFGCFNRPTKLSPPAVAAFAAVLKHVPDSRLVLKYRGLDDPVFAERLVQGFVAEGVEGHRIKLLGSSSHADYFAAYRDIDIALDPFPFGGGVTTCDALWMGGPVVVLAGETFASRHGLSHLTSAGLTEFAANDLDSYVALAASLAQDLGRLAELRTSLREQIAKSPLCDGERLANELLAALRNVWRNWTNQQ